MIDTETNVTLKGMLPAKTVVGHKTGSSDHNADGMKSLNNDASLRYPSRQPEILHCRLRHGLYETDEDNANIIAYHAWYMMR